MKFLDLEDTRASSTGVRISVGLHFIGILVLAVAVPMATVFQPVVPPTESLAVLVAPPLIAEVMAQPKPSGGGGGGGMKAPKPASKGELPRGADQQLLPPLVEMKNLAPELAVEPTIIAPQLISSPFPVIPFGDPNGVVDPPSAGPGSGGGVGDGVGSGVGAGKGPGAGPGEGGSTGGGVFNVGGDVSKPEPKYMPPPEYSEEGRRSRIQGIVDVLIVVKVDGTVDFEKVSKSLGYGLDQKAIEAVKRWKFLPSKKAGTPVAARVLVSVNFSLR
jgi:periplasmic protein TonB